jgi:hypothetical protein
MTWRFVPPFSVTRGLIMLCTRLHRYCPNQGMPAAFLLTSVNEAQM